MVFSRAIALTAVALVLAGATLVWGGEPTEQLRASVDKVTGIVSDPAMRSDAKEPERRAAIRDAAAAIFDFRAAAQRALGPHWRGLGEKDRAEFVQLFSDLLERAYVAKIEHYSGEQIAYVGDVVEPGGEFATVKTTFLTKKGTTVPIDYRVHRRGERWMVYDVFIEGVSLVGNYRAQFDKTIRSASYEELVKKLRAHEASRS
jgi:phospholipid transport system substrate-binding protein